MASSVSSRIGEIFNFAGQAFAKLGELTMHLETSDVNVSGNQKWDEEDIEMFRLTVKKFTEELNKLSENIENKTAAQVRQGIKRRMSDSKGLSHVVSTPVKRVAKGNQSPITTTILAPFSTNHINTTVTKTLGGGSVTSFSASSMDSINEEIVG